MSTDKPKLTPESKRTLLEQSLRWIGLLKLCEDSDKNVPAFFSFTKLILINQSFLGTSRNASFGIYELHLDYYRGWRCESDYLSFKSKHAGYFKGIKVSFERDHKLAKLLQPPKIGIKFNDKVGKKSFNEVIEILKATTGEISLEVTYLIFPFSSLVREFSFRIHRFSCAGKFFTYSFMTLFGLLDELEVKNVRNTGQFLHISKCEVKSLDLSFYKSQLDDPNSFDVSMPKNNKHFLNETVKKLRLFIWGFDHVMTQRIIEQVLKFFPSLTELTIDAVLRFDEHPKSQIPNVALDSCQYMHALKNRLFTNDLRKIALKFKHNLYYEEKCNSKWIKKTYDKTEFDDWECKLKYRSAYNGDNDYRAVILKFNTEEGSNCKFYIKLKVEHKTGTSEDDESDSMEHDGI